MRGDMEGFFQITLDAFKYAFRPKQVARCFRNLGFYFIEKKLWEEAVACHTMSLHFDSKSSQAMSELYYIQQEAGKMIQPPKRDRFREISEEYGFPDGADRDVLGLSYNYGKFFAEKGNTTGAKYCWEITYSLTNDDDIKKQMDQLSSEND